MTGGRSRGSEAGCLRSEVYPFRLKAILGNFQREVNGWNALSWEEKFEMDVWYVDHWSLGLDLRIIGRTVVKVVKREGISAEGEATMPEFNPQITQMDTD